MTEVYKVSRNDASSRFETTVDGVLCVLEYRLLDNLFTINHTGVPDAVGGRGIAAVLTQAALDTARHEGWRVRPNCAYSIAYIEKHPQYRDLVVQA
ncbi:MAG: GNAT family N-acetyltransferase [Dokdonella sp.]